MKDPLISIIVPCYKQDDFLNECLQSISNQRYSNWECIVVNDGGDIETKRIVSQWSNKDDRFKYVYKENGGVSSARNFGITQAKGEWILPLDGDDKINENYLSLASLHFDKADLIYCFAEKFGEENGVWNLPEYSFEKLAIANMIFCSTYSKTLRRNINF